jgi:hypothetical protein
VIKLMNIKSCYCCSQTEIMPRVTAEELENENTVKMMQITT